MACKKTHIAAYNSSIPDSTNNQPHLIINDDLGTIGIEPNDYWIFISGSLTGTPGTPGKSTEVVNTYLEAVALANENNISKIVFVKEEKGVYIITDIGELKKIISTSDLLELAENKVDKELGKGLSTNDFSNTEKAKLKGIEENAQRNVIEEIDLNGVKIDPIDKTVSINTVGSINEQTGDITLKDNSETAWDVNLHMEDHQIQGKVVTPKSVGSETTPVYFNENGEITPINIDDEVTKNSNKLVTSGAIYRSLDLKQNQLIPGDNITIRNNVISATSELNLAKYAKIEDVEKKLSTKQNTLTTGNGISIEGNVIGVTAITESESQPDTSLWLNPSEDEETDVTYNRSQIDAMLGAKQDALTLTVKDNGNIVLSNIQGQSKEFMPATPSGDPMHYAYVAIGAVWNGTGADIVKDAPWAELADDDADKKVVHKAGYWYLNGLGDLTNADMRLVYFTPIFNCGFSEGMYYNTLARTVVCSQTIASSFVRASWKALCRNGKIEILGNNLAYNVNVYDSMIYSFAFTQMKAILYTINLSTTKISSEYSPFANISQLRYIKLKGLNNSLSIQHSSFLTCKSILYMIQNEAATSAITIILHSDAYARAMANADIVAALEAHPNVSLASA